MVHTKKIAAMVAVVGVATLVSTAVYALKCGAPGNEWLQLEPVEVTIDGEPVSLDSYEGAEFELTAGGSGSGGRATEVTFFAWYPENDTEAFEAFFDTTEAK